MSQRLARLAARAARKLQRTGTAPGLFPEVRWTAAARDPWAAIPESARRKETQVLANGTIAETYVDSLDDLRAATPAPPVEPEPGPTTDVSDDPPAAADPVLLSASEEEPPLFARYPMPGHGRD